MQIHELNGYTGALDDAYMAVDNGSDTGRKKIKDITDPLNARIDNIIAGGTAPSAAEVTDARLGANGVLYPSLGAAIREQVTGLDGEINMIRESTKNVFGLVSYYAGNNTCEFSYGVLKNIVADTGGTSKALYLTTATSADAKIADLQGVANMTVGVRYSTPMTKTSSTKYLRIKAGGSSKNLWAYFDISGLDDGDYVLSFTCEGNTVGVVGGYILDEFQIEAGSTETSYEDPYTAKDNVARGLADAAISIIKESKNLNGEWELGGINYDTGAAYSTTSAVRTKFIPVEANKTYAFNIAEIAHAESVYAFFYDSSQTFISKMTADYGYFPKVITVPNNSSIAYVRLNIQTSNIDYSYGQAEENTMSTTYRASTEKCIDYGILPNSVINYRGKNIVVFGDSITAIGDVAATAGSGWTSYFKAATNPAEWHNYAVGGSTWCDYNSGDFMSDQIDAFIADDIPNVDCFILSSGTNDMNITMPSDAEIEAQFYDSSMNFIPLSSVDKSTWAGAMRYAIGTLISNYPMAKILICTPIQRNYSSGEPVRSLYSTIKTKNEIIKKMCSRLGVECVDTGECGISVAAGGIDVYLVDGLHTKPAGAMLMARYILARYMKAFNIE